MKGIQFTVDGNWGHFKKPETNNNPLSHDLITKTALIGLIGAVLGIDRAEMKALFPQLSEDLLYGVRLLKPVKKTSWGFTSKKAINPTAAGNPKYFEFLKSPDFLVSLALLSNRSEKQFDDFAVALQNETAVYPPVLGWHNCPANLKWTSDGMFSVKQEGVFETQGFVLAKDHVPQNFNGSFRVGFDKVPTYQNDDFWNLPEKYVNIIYPDCPHSLSFRGWYYDYLPHGKQVSEKWVLI